MFISTWDGDLFSLAQFNQALDVAEQQQMAGLANNYRNALRGYLERHGVTQMQMTGATGWFEGDVCEVVAGMFRKSTTGRFVSCPSTTGMTRFLKWLEGQKK